MLNNKENRRIRTLSPELRHICDNDSVYSEELKSVVIAHETEAISQRQKNPRKVISKDYATSRGTVKVYSFFMPDGKLNYSHTKFI